MKLDDDLALPTPLTSTTPVPRLRAASASRRVVENLKSLRNKMEPSGAAVERGDTHTPSSSTSFSDPYAFTTQHQPVYSPPHLPRSQTWSHSESPGFVQQHGDGGSGIVSDTNTNTDNDTGTRLDHGHGSSYALHGSSTSADAYGPSPDDDGYNARRGQDLQSFRRIRHNNNEDTFDNSRDIDTSLLVPNNSDSPGSGSDPCVEYVNVNGHRHIHLNSSPRRSQSSLARLLNFSATDVDDNVDEALAGLVHRIPSRSRSVGEKGKRTMNERIGGGGDGEEGKEKDKGEEREDRDWKRARLMDRDEEQEVNKERDEEDEEEKENGDTGLGQQPSTPTSTSTLSMITTTTTTPKTRKGKSKLSKAEGKREGKEKQKTGASIAAPVNTAMAMTTTTATATTPAPTLPSEPEPEPEPHIRESSTTPYPTPISPKSLPDLLSTHSLSTYNCPICFSPPTNATMTPCGHVACGPCLFTAVKTALRRETMMMGGAIRDEGGPRCPVCRAPIPGWDGKGGGVVGLVVQVVVTA